eukprot:1156895-Pelagomonas_calceolata.AAC.1
MLMLWRMMCPVWSWDVKTLLWLCHFLSLTIPIFVTSAFMKCIKELGYYTDGQRQEIDTADTWSCPACAGLNNAQKVDRERQSREG